MGSVEEGLWLRAERQTAGRGRLGREWVSPPGNLYASTAVRLRPSDPLASDLSLMAGVAVEEAVTIVLDAAGQPAAPALKWPNDLLIDGAKVAGILLERRDDVVVVGIGVNLAHHPDLPDKVTVSLASLGAPTQPAAFVELLAETFARWLARWRSEGLRPVRERWLARAHPVGTALLAQLPDGVVLNGLFDGLDAQGSLLLRLASGERRVIHAGDLVLL